MAQVYTQHARKKIMRFAAAKAYKSWQKYSTVHNKRWKLKGDRLNKNEANVVKAEIHSNPVELNAKLFKYFDSAFVPFDAVSHCELRIC